MKFILNYNQARAMSQAQKGCHAPVLPLPRCGRSPRYIHDGLTIAILPMSSAGLAQSPSPTMWRAVCAAFAEAFPGVCTSQGSPISTTRGSAGAMTSRQSMRRPLRTLYREWLSALTSACGNSWRCSSAVTCCAHRIQASSSWHRSSARPG